MAGRGAEGQTVASNLLVTSSRFVVLSLSGCLSSLGTLPKADRPCCQRKGPQGPLSRTRGSYAAVVAELQSHFSSLGTSSGPCSALSPSISRAQGSNWLPLPSSPALHPLRAQRLWQGTRQAPGKTVGQWLLGAFRGLAHSSLSFANGKAG